MADTKDSKPLDTSANKDSPRTPRTVSFTIPEVKRPSMPAMPPIDRVRSWVLVVGFIAVALVGGVGGAILEGHYSQNGLLSSVSNQKKVVTSQSQLISTIAKNVGESVVSVNVSISGASSRSSSLSELYGGGSGAQSEEAAGTGIIISDSGLIMTNRHVVPEGTTSVSVTLSDGTELKNVQVVGRTNTTDSLDVAFLKITDAKGHKLHPATIGDSSKVQVGDDVVAIGNALGQFQNTVTSGIISGYGRSVQAGDSGDQSADATTENLDNLFQTDAAINEGNSGGPLVNLNGQVIGINTAIAGNAQNIGFSIPINDVRGLVEQVLKTGKFERPYLGVRYVPLTADLADQYDLKTTNGAYIAPATQGGASSVIASGPAEEAGLKEGDIITQVDGSNVDQTHSLTSLLNKHQPGDKISVKIQRGSDMQDVEVTLGTLPTAQQ